VQPIQENTREVMAMCSFSREPKAQSPSVDSQDVLPRYDFFTCDPQGSRNSVQIFRRPSA
jgi:hypothetical protein